MPHGAGTRNIESRWSIVSIIETDNDNLDCPLSNSSLSLRSCGEIFARCKDYYDLDYVNAVMASGLRPETDRYLSGPGSGRFSNMVRSGRVGPASVKYPRNLGRPPEPVRTDRVFISM